MTDGVVEAEGVVAGQLLDLVTVQVVGFLKVSKEDSLVRIRQVEINVQVAVATVDYLVLNIDDLAEFYVVVKAFAFAGLRGGMDLKRYLMGNKYGKPYLNCDGHFSVVGGR